MVGELKVHKTKDSPTEIIKKLKVPPLDEKSDGRLSGELRVHDLRRRSQSIVSL